MKQIIFFTKRIILVMLGALVIGGSVTAYLAFTKPPFQPTYYADTNVQCLPRGHNDLAVTWRMQILIVVDGVPEALPRNIGNTMACTTELHTHEEGDLVHAEFYNKSRVEKLTLADFFAVWGKPLEREGHTLAITRGGESVQSLDMIQIQNKQAVTLTYTTATTTTSMQLSSEAFASGEMIPARYTCDANHELPPLKLTNVPEGTKSFVLVMDDADIPQEVKDARGIEKFDHLIFYNLPGDLREFSDEILQTKTFTTGTNSAGTTEYYGPCPPRDLEPYTHRYSFRIYALSGELNFIKSPTLDEVETAAKGSALAHAELIGTYTRHK